MEFLADHRRADAPSTLCGAKRKIDGQKVKVLFRDDKVLHCALKSEKSAIFGKLRRLSQRQKLTFLDLFLNGMAPEVESFKKMLILNFEVIVH